MKFSIFNLKLLIIAIVFLSPIGTRAATFFFDPISEIVVAGQEFVVELKMDAEEDIINAIEGKIEFPHHILRIKQIDVSDSIVHAWITEPEVHDDEIIFSGIVPGGFDGVRRPFEPGKFAGPLFKIIFEAKKSGSEAVIIKEIQALKNDGLGSETISATVPFSIDVLSSGEDNRVRILPFIIIAIIVTICLRAIKFFF